MSPVNGTPRSSSAVRAACTSSTRKAIGNELRLNSTPIASAWSSWMVGLPVSNSAPGRYGHHGERAVSVGGAERVAEHALEHEAGRRIGKPGAGIFDHHVEPHSVRAERAEGVLQHEADQSDWPSA